MQGFNKSVRCPLSAVQSTYPVSDTILQITTQSTAVSTNIEVSLHHLQQPFLTTLTGKHALGDRARKLDQGILIVRFELPFNIWW
jgi:hypothetical protein